MTDKTSDTPYSRIIKALHDIVMLHSDENDAIARDPVMAEVQHIRNDADELQRRLAAAEKDARNKALEEAAKMCNSYECVATAPCAGAALNAVAFVRDEIRALKSK